MSNENKQTSDTSTPVIGSHRYSIVGVQVGNQEGFLAVREKDPAFCLWANTAEEAAVEGENALFKYTEYYKGLQNAK